MNFHVQVNNPRSFSNTVNKPSKCDPVRIEFFESDVEILITLYKR